jgi:hypothetical protein
MIDCSKMPNEIGCPLTIAASGEEVLAAVAKNSHQDTSEEFFLDRIAVEPGDGARPAGDRGPGAGRWLPDRGRNSMSAWRV